MAYRCIGGLGRGLGLFIAGGLGLLTIGGCTVYVDQPQQVAPTYQPVPVQQQPVAPVADQDVPYQPPPQDVVTVYQSDLDSYGVWVNVQGYGQCWQPNGRPYGWQPYTVGHWIYTDCGWTWVSDGDEAAWGDVPYHYGRWYSSPDQGWVWIPGTIWGPAWVAWREGGGYCGWAPLPPQCGFGTDYSADQVDAYVPAQSYVYCDEQYVSGGRVDQHIVRNNVTIINNTTNITNITYVNNTVVNRGISVDNVQRASGRPVEKVTLARATTPEEARSLAAAGKPVIYSPQVVQQAQTQRIAQIHAGAKNPVASPQEKPLPEDAYKPQETNPQDSYKPKDVNPPVTEQKPIISGENPQKTEQEKTPQEKQPEEKQPTDKQVEEKQPQEKQAPEKQPDEKQIQEKQPSDKQPTDKEAPDKQPQAKQPTDKQAPAKQPDNKQQQDQQSPNNNPGGK
jgi:hypothetical protein